MKKVRACESYEKLRLKAWDWYPRGDRKQSVSEIVWVWEWVESEIVWKMGDAVVWRCGAQGPERQRVRELKSEDEKWTEILRYRLFVQMERISLSLRWVDASRETKKKKMDVAPIRRQPRRLRVTVLDIVAAAVLQRPCIPGGAGGRQS